ncbi:MAG: hypothetical protein A3K61_01745 [Thaumarchaeota archaeon RBG_16_49_8]|nr:MAG: hypothetical protein A3K61_01745 [Thaumarchaeota archaeon RBG_16_49_8]
MSKQNGAARKRLLLTLGALALSIAVPLAIYFAGEAIPPAPQPPQTYSQAALQSVVDDATNTLKQQSLADKISSLKYNDGQFELGFYGKTDPRAVEIVKNTIDKRTPGVPLRVVENTTATAKPSP